MSPLACAVAKKRYGLANQQRSECGGSVAVNVSLVTPLVRCTVPARKGVLIYPKLCHSEGRSHVGGGGEKDPRRHSAGQNLYPAVMRCNVLAERSVYAFATRRCRAGTEQYTAW